MDGQALFVDTFFDGAMQKTYRNVSAVLGGAQTIKKLGLAWKSFKALPVSITA